MKQNKHKTEKKENKYLLATDYSIPRFGFKQAVLLMITLFLTFGIGTMILENVSGKLVLPLLLLLSIIIGYSISFIQFYKKDEVKKARKIVGALFSVLVFIILFSFYFANTIF